MKIANSARIKPLTLFLLVMGALLVFTLPKDAEADEETVDNISPTFVSARTDSIGDKIIITFSEEVFISPLVRYVKELYNVPLHNFLRAAFDVSVDGHEIYQIDSSISSTDLTIDFAYDGGRGNQVRVAYKMCSPETREAFSLTQPGMPFRMFPTRPSRTTLMPLEQI